MFLKRQSYLLLPARRMFGSSEVPMFSLQHVRIVFFNEQVYVCLELAPRRAVSDGSSSHAVDIVIDVGRYFWWEAVAKHLREELHFSLTVANTDLV